MKFIALLLSRAVLLVAAPLVLTACATTYREYPQDLAKAEQLKVSPTVYQRMSQKQPLTLDDVKELSRRSYPPISLVRYMQSTGQVYRLETKDVNDLQKAKVDRGVIDYMLSTPDIFLRQQISRERAMRPPFLPPPFYYGGGYYYHPRYYRSGVSIGVGTHWGYPYGYYPWWY